MVFFRQLNARPQTGWVGAPRQDNVMADSRQLGHKDAHRLPDASRARLVDVLDDTHPRALQAHPDAFDANDRKTLEWFDWSGEPNFHQFGTGAWPGCANSTSYDRPGELRRAQPRATRARPLAAARRALRGFFTDSTFPPCVS